MEAASGKAFDSSTTPLDTEVDQFCVEAEALVDQWAGFQIAVVTETNELHDVDYPAKQLLLKYPIDTLTKLEERRGTTYTTLTEGPTDDYTVEKESGIVNASPAFGHFDSGPEKYRATYDHGLPTTDRRYKLAKAATVKLAMISVISAELGQNGIDILESMSAGGISTGFTDTERNNLLQDAVRMVKAIRGEYRGFMDAG